MKLGFKALGLVLTMSLVGCQTVNTTSGDSVGVQRKQYMFSLLSTEQINQSSALQYQEMIQTAASKGMVERNTPNARRLEVIGQRLIKQAPYYRADAASWPWEVNLIKSPELNASCMPGGKIIFFSGIIEKLQLTDDEIAAIMGHEIAHALREHSREAMSKAYALEVGKLGLVTLLGLGEQGMQLTNAAVEYGLTLPNSRSAETEADLLGIELAARAGYNPQAAVTLWQKMAQASSGAPPEFLSTHPASASRINTLQAVVPKVLPIYQQAKNRY